MEGSWLRKDLSKALSMIVSSELFTARMLFVKHIFVDRAEKFSRVVKEVAIGDNSCVQK